MARGKANKTGRVDKMPSFTPLLHYVMDNPAFLSLTPLAVCLYIRLRRLAGHDGLKNEQAFYSTRDAAKDFDTHQDTVRRAFYLLQASGFIVAEQVGSLGVTGEGKATPWRLTELPTPSDLTPTKEFLSWRPGADFRVAKGRPPVNKARNPALLVRAGCPSGAGDWAGLPEGPALSSRAHTDSARGTGVRGREAA